MRKLSRLIDMPRVYLMRSQGCLLDSGLPIQKPMRGPQFTAGFLSLYYFDTEFLNVKGLIELQNAKENAQGTTDHNYNLQKSTWTMGAPENPRHSEQIVLGEPDTSESKFQLADGLTQPGEDRGRMGVGTPLSISITWYREVPCVWPSLCSGQSITVEGC